VIIRGVTDPSLSLEIVCEHYETLKNDTTANIFLGKVIIPLFPFQTKTPKRQWYKLLGSHGDNDGLDRGEVCLNISWHFNPELDVPRRKPSVVDTSHSSQPRPHRPETAYDDSFIISSMLKYAKMPMRELTVSDQVHIIEERHKCMGEVLIYHRIFPKCCSSMYTSVG
jgi:hypothetical protein